MEPALASDGEHEPKLPTSGSFSWKQFLAQLPLQLFLPLSLPIAALYSPALALNIFGLPKPASLAHLPAVLLLLTLQGAPLVAVLAWLAMPAETAPNSLLAATLRADALHVIVALASLRIAVSFKYAFMPSETYARRCSTWATTQERSEEQLVSGWQFLKPALVQRCLGIAAAEQHVDAASAAVRLPRGALPHLLAALECDEARAAVTQAIAAAEGVEACKEGVVQLRSASASASSHCSIPATALSQALVLAASREASLFAGRAFILNLLTALGSTFTTTILRAALGAPLLGTSAAEATLILGHIFANLFSLGVTLQFLFIGAIDHLRRARAQALLGRLFSLRPGGRPALLPLDCPGNVQALVAVRAMLLDFGRHFHERLVLVVSFSLITFACVAAYVIIALYRAPSGDLAPLLSPFILLHVLVLPALVSCGLSLHQASHANSEMGKLGAVVVEARLHERLRRAAAARVGGEGEGEGPLLALLGDCESLFNAQGDKGIRILNATASGALTQAFLGAWLSLESTALVLFLQRLYGS